MFTLDEDSSHVPLSVTWYERRRFRFNTRATCEVGSLRFLQKILGIKHNFLHPGEFNAPNFLLSASNYVVNVNASIMFLLEETNAHVVDVKGYLSPASHPKFTPMLCIIFAQLPVIMQRPCIHHSCLCV